MRAPARHAVLLWAAAASGVHATKGVKSANRTLGAWSIAKCDLENRKPSPRREIPDKACAREDLHRNDLCSLLSKSPPTLPASVMERARLHPERRDALERHVNPKQGARIVEVGTMTGALAKYIVRTFKPAELVVMDVDSWAIGQCHGRTTAVAREVKANTTVRCIKGDSKANLQALEDNAFDLIYIDGAHDYKGCLLYTSPSPRDQRGSRMPSSA